MIHRRAADKSALAFLKAQLREYLCRRQMQRAVIHASGRAVRQQRRHQIRIDLAREALEVEYAVGRGREQDVRHDASVAVRDDVAERRRAAEGSVDLHVNLANPTISTASSEFIAAAATAPGWEGQVWSERIAVPLTTLDRLIARHGAPAFVKIDVEGFEAEVLAGLDRALDALVEARAREGAALDAFATWCAPCVKELPSLVNLQKAVPGMKVLAVDVGHDTPQKAAAFLKDHKADSLGVYVDTELALLHAFGAYGLPTTVLSDPSGKEVAKAQEPAEWNAPEFVAYFKSLASS